MVVMAMTLTMRLGVEVVLPLKTFENVGSGNAAEVVNSINYD